MIFPPTLRTTILAALNVIDEAEGGSLLAVVRDYRRACVSPRLRRFAGVSEPRFEIALTDLVRDGKVARRAAPTDQGSVVWLYRLLRQWPATTESMGHVAGRMMARGEGR